MKLISQPSLMCFTRVAPHAGAWIETCTHGSMDKLVQRSPPTRGRGLKLIPAYPS